MKRKELRLKLKKTFGHTKVVDRYKFYPHEVLLAQFSLYVHKGGINPILISILTHKPNATVNF